MCRPRRRAPAPGSSAFAAIWRAVARIPRGRVATYGQVARMAGIPGGARTVGWALRALPDGLAIGGRPVPWQRVVNAAGRISPRGGFAADGEVRAHAAALRREGIRVGGDGSLDLARHLWDGAIPATPRRGRSGPRGAAGGPARAQGAGAPAGPSAPNWSSKSR